MTDDARSGPVGRDKRMEFGQLQAFYAEQGLELSLEAFAAMPHPIYTASVPGGDAATALWHRLRALTDETGFWPLLTGASLKSGSGHFWFEEAADQLETAAWLKKAAGLDPAARFAAEAGQLPDADEELDEWAEYAEEMGMAPPEYGPQAGFLSVNDSLTRQPYQHLSLVLLPTRRGYEAAAWLGFGGWNSCPEPDWQVAIQRYWYERYGAEPAVMTGDVLEMAVARPPRSDEEALRLAREQYLFCDDIVLQGVMTLDNLKQSLIDSPYWYFWWD